MQIKYAGENALRYFKTKVVALINSAKSAAATAQTSADNAASAAATAQSTANSAVSAANANTSALGNKVDKVSGKGLSTNDYTTTEKNKLAGIAAGANNYILPEATESTYGGVLLYYGEVPVSPTGEVEVYGSDNYATTLYAVREECKAAMLAAWPIGSVIITTENTNPQAGIGGTWSEVELGIVQDSTGLTLYAWKRTA